MSKPHAPSSQQPRSIEAEQSLLGAILVNGEALDRVENIGGADDFFEQIHQYIYATMVAAKQQGLQVETRRLLQMR